MADTCLLKFAMSTSPTGLEKAIEQAACDDISKFIEKIKRGLSDNKWPITDTNVKFYGHYVLQMIIQEKIKEIYEILKSNHIDEKQLEHFKTRIKYFGLDRMPDGTLVPTSEPTDFMIKFMDALPVSESFAGESYSGYSSYIQGIFSNPGSIKIRRAFEPTSAIKQCESALGMTSKDIKAPPPIIYVIYVDVVCCLVSH